MCWQSSARVCRPRSWTTTRAHLRPSTSLLRHYSTTRPSRTRSTRAWPALVASSLVLGGAAYYHLLAPERRSTTLNPDTFVPYTITSREAVSPTSVVVAVSPQTPDPSPPHLRPGTSLWRHALWSVEFKQPEVQIARHYTPLPPVDGGDDAARGCLRFYVRAVPGGEMSNYLTRLAVGRRVWLRGPHAGFDVLQRLGPRGRVVFLAGGTGLVPALQVAAAVLDGSHDTTMALFWAVRKRDEVQTLTEPAPSRWSWWSTKAPTRMQADLAEPSPIACQLKQIKAKYGDRLDIRLAIDEDGTVIREADVEGALLLPPPSRASPTPPSRGCPCHDQRLHADASESNASEASCRCPTPDGGRGPGKNLLMVSGPDGFVAHYAGPKAWLRGTLTQGPVSGVAGRLQGRHARLADEWLVLKL
ncbi:hypothetical protein G6O67_003025 [Ophiocordyceps sinensis]|uniref:FAD-binding FR-type domain-containing protein n=2 Tax=Ophiocordyceps sinensis TaxID=72228 RepID=A0A8H4PVH0_9HYPO|nr:hypothetical protein G6O67_003025 [Ophiocordyceps sinensis]